MITIILYGQFRTLYASEKVVLDLQQNSVNGVDDSHEKASGTDQYTLEEIINALIEACPSMKRYLLTIDDSAFRNNAMLILDQKVLTSLENIVIDGSQLELLPATVGG